MSEREAEEWVKAMMFEFPDNTGTAKHDRRLLGTLPSMEHVMAQEEVKSLLRQLKLRIGERGRRRAANRVERFNQVNKPLEVHDIFGHLPLLTQVRLELREDTQHVEERLSGCRAGIDRLLGGL